MTGDRDATFVAKAVYTEDSGYLSKISGARTGKFTFIHAGTSLGKLVKVILTRF